MAHATSPRFLSVSPLLPAPDVEDAIAFYGTHLGFALDYRDAEPAQFAIVRHDAVVLHLYATPDRALAEATSLRIGIEGIDALYERCLAAGCVHPNGLLGSRPWGTREFTVVDPSGVCIAFVQADDAPHT